MKIDCPLKLRIVAANENGDLFVTEEVTITPGESVTWTYPLHGIPIQVDAPVRMSA